MRSNLIVAAVLVMASPAFAGDFLPLDEGTRWTYEHSQKTRVAGMSVTTNAGTLTLTAKGRETIGAASAVVLEIEGDAGHPLSARLHVDAAASGIVLLGVSSSDDLFLLPADFEKRAARCEIRTQDGKALCIDSRVEETSVELETPAGRFTCRQVTATVSVAGTHVRRTAYYAKGVGL